MTNELKHKTVGTELTQAEWEAIGTHVFNSQATGDILYASSGTQLSKLAIGTTNYLLTVTGGVPAWTATPTITSITTSTFDLGTSSSPASYTAGSPVFEIYATSSNTTSTNAEPFYVKSVMTGVGGYGGRSRFHAYTNVALGSNFMALKAHAEYGSSGSCAGLSTGLCSELVMPNADITSAGGAYYALELEYVSGGSSLVTNGTGCQAGFIYMNQSGDDNGDFDDNGWFMRVDGLTAGAGHILSAGKQTLKTNLEGTTRYLVMSTEENRITMGATGAPAGDFTLWGTTANYKVWFDVSGDTNGKWYFGDNDYGVDVLFSGQTADNYALWDASNELLSLVSTAKKAFDISTSLTGATAIDGAKMSFTAATTSSAKVSHGSSEGLYIYQDISGTKTGSARTEALSIVQTVTGSGACPDIYGAHIHWHNAGNPVVGNLIGLQVDLDDPGNACGNCMALDVYRDGANNTTTRDCMIRCANGGSATIPYAILLEGSYSAVFQLTIQGGTAVGGAVGGSNTKKIPVNVSNIAGETGTVYYMPLYTS